MIGQRLLKTLMIPGTSIRVRHLTADMCSRSTISTSSRSSEHRKVLSAKHWADGRRRGLPPFKRGFHSQRPPQILITPVLDCSMSTQLPDPIFFVIPTRMPHTRSSSISTHPVSKPILPIQRLVCRTHQELPDVA